MGLGNLISVLSEYPSDELDFFLSSPPVIVKKLGQYPLVHEKSLLHAD